MKIANPNLNWQSELKFFNVIFQQIDQGAFIIGADGIILEINKGANRIIENRARLLAGMQMDTLKIDFAAVKGEIHKNEYWTGPGVIHGLDGEEYTYQFTIRAVELPYTTEYLATFPYYAGRNIKHRLADQVFQTIDDGILYTDKDKRIISVNPAFEIVTGYREHEVLGKTPKILQSGLHDREFYKQMWSVIEDKGVWKGEIWNKRKNGEVYPEWISISAVTGEDGDTNYMAVFSDISARKATEERLLKLAHFDVLTGAGNRHFLYEKMEALLHYSKKHNRMFAILFIDLDRFKQINDTLGHNYGDQLLKQFVMRLETMFEDCIIGRLGGDEFVICIPDIKHVREAANMATEIINSMKAPFLLYEQEIHASASVGISLYPLDGKEQHSLLKNADMAMYQAKALGRNHFEFYHAGLRERNQTRKMVLANRLHSAIDKNQLSLFYQPQADARTGEITGVEALIRWHEPEYGFIPPSEFIHIAEENGLIIPISEWVCTRACEDMSQLHHSGFPSLKVSINISAIHFRQDEFVKSISEIIQNSNINPRYLELELTESMIMPNAEESVRRLVRLKQLGVKIAIDDFGTGFSSLSYLNRFPIDSLKIDQSFIKNIINYEEDAAITKAIITMARSLSMDVVAEGVENKKQMIFLQQENCNTLQGYYISRPVPLNELTTLLHSWEPAFFK
ncbi:EAL domain-containing protein [Peribacillus sp. SCS-155]|uniref:EAL domain-containing protein n=1 Tax=Peribacillus sedimenti TaxID=3115297 RepID=UPI0039058C00